MKKTILVIILFSAVLLPAREINPQNPDFNHTICLNSHSVNPSASQTRFNKAEALAALLNLKSFDVERQSRLQHLHLAYRAYYNKLSSSIKSDSRELFSDELNRQLDLSGSCENVDSVLIDIIRNLK